jgi:DNA-directed RNA polymerase sigma subunit (sigma70/sigma32)
LPARRRENKNMRTFIWPAEDGWPYPDSGPEVSDPQAEVDDDLLSMLAGSKHLLDGLNSVERQVITDHYGLSGHPACSMKQLHNQMGLSRSELRNALGSGLAKLRTQLA